MYNKHRQNKYTWGYTRESHLISADDLFRGMTNTTTNCCIERIKRWYLATIWSRIRFIILPLFWGISWINKVFWNFLSPWITHMWTFIYKLYSFAIFPVKKLFKVFVLGAEKVYCLIQKALCWCYSNTVHPIFKFMNDYMIQPVSKCLYSSLSDFLNWILHSCVSFVKISWKWANDNLMTPIHG